MLDGILRWKPHLLQCSIPMELGTVWRLSRDFIGLKILG